MLDRRRFGASVGFLALAGVTAAASRAMAPTALRGTDAVPRLESMLPDEFAGWTRVVYGAAAVVNPQVQEQLDKLYADLASRVYESRQLGSVMLSIAYGANQSESHQLHVPEACYPAQGFSIRSNKPVELNIASRIVPATRLVAVMGPRIEPITYWMVVGDTAVRRGFDAKRIRLRYALERRIPDGVIFRVSSIDSNTDRAFEIHRRFVEDMFEVAGSSAKDRLLGSAAKQDGRSIAASG